VCVKMHEKLPCPLCIVKIHLEYVYSQFVNWNKIYEYDWWSQGLRKRDFCVLWEVRFDHDHTNSYFIVQAS
jgi:hypothetical protein